MPHIATICFHRGCFSLWDAPLLTVSRSVIIIDDSIINYRKEISR
jgi:hypothetical protein